MVKLIEGVNADRRGGVLRARGGGGDTLDINKIPSTLGFAQKQEAGITDALKSLILKQRGQEKPLDVYTQLEEAMKLPEQRKVAQTIREQIGNIEDTIKRVRPTIAKTTSQSLVTEGQRQRMETTQKKPLLENLSTLTTNLGRLEQGISSSMKDLGNKVNLFLQGQQIELEPLKLQLQVATDRAARLTSAFGVDAQNQLNVLMANWQRQNQLDDREYEQAFNLLQKENTYTRELQKSAASVGARFSSSTSNEDLLKLIGDAYAESLNYERYIKPFQKMQTGNTNSQKYYDKSNTNYYGNIDLSKYSSWEPLG